MKENIACIKFRSCICKFSYRNIEKLELHDKCVIETDDGIECGVVIAFEDVEIEESNNTEDGSTLLFLKKNCAMCKCDTEKNTSVQKIKNKKNRVYFILRLATSDDKKQAETNEINAKEAYKVCKEKVLKHQINLKLVSSYYFLDRGKLLFEFTADQRVDFRELVKDLASYFKTRIELKQIGVRDEAKSVGGCGPCGREICCNVMGNAFEVITIKMAKEQGMPLATSKISGQCGRLMCCLAYEYKTYCEIKKDLPKIGTVVKFNESNATIKDINPISRKLLIETADRRLLYVDIENVVIEKGL